MAVLEDYAAALKSAPLSDQTRRTYASKVRQFLAWLADADSEGDPLSAADARDWAVRDYRMHLQAVLKRKPATVNNALAAVDDLYIRRGLGPARAARAELPKIAPKALSKRAAVRFLRATEACPSPRDRAIALIPFYAGTRIAEIVGCQGSREFPSCDHGNSPPSGRPVRAGRSAAMASRWRRMR